MRQSNTFPIRTSDDYARETDLQRSFWNQSFYETFKLSRLNFYPSKVQPTVLSLFAKITVTCFGGMRHNQRDLHKRNKTIILKAFEQQ